MVEYKIEGYDIYDRNVIGTDVGRGLLLYVDKRLKANLIQMKQEYTENLCIEVRGTERAAIIASIYRSPNSSSTEDENLNKLIKEIDSKESYYKILVGDFNMPSINWERYTTTAGLNSTEFKFIETVRDCYLTQHVTEITRQRGEGRGNVLDLIFSNEEEIVEEVNVEAPLGRSDHACTV